MAAEDWWTRLEGTMEKQRNVAMDCLVCGESLARRRLDARTCSDRCRTQLSRRRLSHLRATEQDKCEKGPIIRESPYSEGDVGRYRKSSRRSDR